MNIKYSRENITAKVNLVHRKLKQNIDKRYKSTEARLFPEGRNCYGVRIPITRKIAKKVFEEIKSSSKNDVFAVCEELLASKLHEPLVIAFQLAYELKKKYTKSDFKIFESWLKKYVRNWSSCDDFCCNTLGEILFQYPELLQKTFLWTKSSNKWLRRASSVSLIYSIRRKKNLKQVFKTANALLNDNDDMVQKGYGWMLKEASNHYPKEIFWFVMKKKEKMPRIALRYAIEKLPSKLRRKALK